MSHALRAVLSAALFALLALGARAQGTPGTWEPTTPGSPCADGTIPLFQPLGSLHDNPGVAAWQVIPVMNGPPNATAFLVVGFQELGAPFKGGVLGPAPTLLRAFQLEPDGYQNTGFLLGVMPEPLPHGFSIWFQWWIADPGVATGFCSTRTVRGTITTM